MGGADQGRVPVEEKVGVGLAVETPDAAAELVELRQTEAVRALDDQRVAVRDVEAGLDDRRADEDVVLARDEGRHHFLELARRHLAMADDDAGLRQQRGQAFGDGLDGLHAVVQVEDLAAAG